MVTSDACSMTRPAAGRGAAVSLGRLCSTCSGVGISGQRRCIPVVVVLMFVGAGACFEHPARAEQRDDPAAERASEIDYRRQRVVNQTLYRLPDQCLLLERFEHHLAKDNLVEASELYQQLLDLPHDSFVWRGHEIRSLRQETLAAFEQHPRLWKVYTELHGKAAEQVEGAVSEERRRQVARRYYHTAAGFQAMTELAGIAWDRGELDTAAHLWGLLLGSRFHASRITARQLEQVTVVAELARDEKLQAAVERFFTRQQPADGRGARTLVSDTEGLRERIDLAMRSAIPIWRHPHQDGMDQGWSEHTPPVSKPAWGISRMLFNAEESSLGSLAEHSLRLSLELWATQQHEQLSPELTSLFAVVAGDVLVFRDLEAVHAVSIASEPFEDGMVSKRPLWRFSSNSPLADAVTYESDPFTGVTTNHPSVDRMHLANSLTGSLTTDGQRVYFIDGIVRLSPDVPAQTAAVSSGDVPVSSTPDEPHDTRLANRVLALPVAGTSRGPRETVEPQVAPVWSVGPQGWERSEAGQSGLSDHPLRGHYFLGPPVVHQQRAYVLSEQESQIWLTALAAETGGFVWSQPISFVDRKIENDIIRATRACMAVCAGGLVLCDNGNGQLVAVDAVLGDMQWVHCYADDDARQDSGRWTYTQSSRVSQPGVLNLPVVVEEKVYLLPDRSSFISCCDLKTGRLLWTRPREDTEYLAGVVLDASRISRNEAAPESRVLAVGARKCRALDGQTGRVLWDTPIGFISGHGVQAGTAYLLPVSGPGTLPARKTDGTTVRSQGRVLALDLLTGERFGLDSGLEKAELRENRPEGGFAFPLGNLLACNQQVIAVGINQIIGFPQAGAVIAKLEQLGERYSLTERQLQQLAGAELVLGHITRAKQHLRQALQLPDTRSVDRLESLSMYRELLYRELRDQADGESVAGMPSILEELESLADSPAQQARYLLTEIELLLKQGHSEELWLATERFTELGVSIPVSTAVDASHFSTSASWLPGMYDRMFRQLTPQEKQVVLNQFETNWLERLRDLSSGQLLTILDIFAGQPLFEDRSGTGGEYSCQAESVEESPRSHYERCAIRDIVRLELICRCLREGDVQQAELRLLELMHGGLPRSQLLACQGLVNLYSRLGDYRQAGKYLQEMSALSDRQVFQLEREDWSRLLTYVSSPADAPVIETVSHLLPPGNTRWLEARDYLVHFDRQHPSWQAYRHRSGLTQPVTQVSIREERGQPPLLSDPFSRRRLLHALTDRGCLVMQQVEVSRPQANPGDGGQTGETRAASPGAAPVEEQHLLLLDQASGVVRHRIALPGTRIGISNAIRKEMGYLFPVIVEGHVLGISLLTGQPCWERGGDTLEAVYPSEACRWERDAEGVVRAVPAERLVSATRPRRVELGPVGSGYCVVQTARALTCLDPATGRLLWRRGDLDPQGGLWGDRAMGVIGDEHVMVYFHPDQNAYSLLETQTGTLLRRGRLEVGQTHIQRTRHAYGRLLMYLAVSGDANQERRLRLWDPLRAELVLDEAYAPHDLFHASAEELTLLGAEGRLRIYRPLEARQLVDVKLDEQSRVRANYLRVQRCGERYLINMYQTQRNEAEQGYTSRYTEAPWNMTHINGPVIAVNATTGQLEWTRLFGNRSLLDDEASGLPFVVMCANFQQRPGDQERSLLLEVVDLRTGETLELRNDLPVGRLMLVNHVTELGEVRLAGLDREIVIGYQARIDSRLKKTP